MILRPYQARSVPALRAAYAAGHRAVLYVLPTGGGKTRVAVAIVELAITRAPVLFLAHRKELIDQFVRTLAEAGILDVRIIRAGDSGPADARVTAASVPTLTSFTDLPEAGLVIVDEAHHAKATTWSGILGRYPQARILGLSATPQRGDGRSLGDVFQAIVVGATVRELTELGYLVRCRTWSPAEQLDAGKLAISPLEAYQRFGEGRRAVVFCASVKHAADTAAELHAAGVPAGVIHGKLSEPQRDAALAALRAGEIRVVANVDVLTEGTDIPELAVCILARRFRHAGGMLQAGGRVLRPAAEKPYASLVDLCGSVLEHGTLDADREYTLDGRGIRSVDRLALRQCTTCGSVFGAGPTACTFCGTVLPVRPRPEPRVVGAKLGEVGYVAPRPIVVTCTARKSSLCPRCARAIQPGERIAFTKIGAGRQPARHVDCAQRRAA